ncbi:MAG: flavodoxin domain-containing protein [Bacteroidota bacterium]
MKTIVVFYSNKGSNRYLAGKISRDLSCDLEEIRPRLNVFLLFLMNIHLGIRPLKSNMAAYDRVILCGPIWMGRFIPPLRSFIKKYKTVIGRLIFVTCCGSTFAKKDEKFGHGLVFREVESLLDGKCLFCQAFPVGLVMPEEQREDPNAFMKAHLNDENFKGEIENLYSGFIKKVTEASR